MIQHLRQLSLLNKIFNVHGNEWSKIIASWTISFLYRVGFVIGWTIIVSLFVSRFGIASLPFLFVVNGVFTIIGSLFFSFLLQHFRNVTLMVANLFIGSLILLAAYLFSSSSDLLFFALMLMAEAIFFVQFRIMLNGFIEEMFTPLQSERTFPLIEASETIGGIVAGLAITIVSGYLNVSSFLLVWIALSLAIVPLIFIYQSMSKKVPHFSEKNLKVSSLDIFSKLKNEISDSNHYKYVKGLFIIVLFQWILFNLLEFQYTKAVYKSVSGVILVAGSGFEHALFHDLGALFILISASALVVQLFIGSRLINSLGVVGSMLLHPIVTILSIFGLTFSYNFPTAVLAKNNFTITSVIHLNAYHSSYYAVKDSLREYVREFLDGIVRPLGAILGTGVIIGLQFLFKGNSLIFYVNALMLVVAFALLFVTFRQQKKYTDVALDSLNGSADRDVRINAVDILSQRGHDDSLPHLRSILKNRKEPVSLRVQILKAFGELQEDSTLPDIVHCLGSDCSEIREAAIDSLLEFKLLFKNDNNYLVIEHSLVDSLEKLFKKEVNYEVRSKVLQFLSRLSTVATFEFLLHALKSLRGNLKAEVIYALGNFGDRDVVQFIRPYLKSTNPKLHWAAIMALGRFDEFREEAVGHIYSGLNADTDDDIARALFAVGEMGIRKKKKVCYEHLKSDSLEIRINAAIALAKMGYSDCIPVLTDLLFHTEEKTSMRVKRMLKNVDVRISKNLDKIIRHLVVQEVTSIIPEDSSVSIDKIDRKDLKTLKWLYSLSGEYEEVEHINKFI
ncbi:hypothetical protein HN709_00085 [Candidatus Peregrinibacteria bacterium]|jgi:HEAT repeat protein|nr:hypothetical protein [Candidatus Peregrinibacteria bacterium]MBT7736071.1 hypothetical protein [Candidatus Peregrinibacteria bacterium]